MRKCLFFVTVGALALSLFNTSCTIEKRRYMAGYHVDWNSNKKSTSKHDENKKYNSIDVASQTSVPEVKKNAMEPVFHQQTEGKSLSSSTPIAMAVVQQSPNKETNNSPTVLNTISKTQLMSKIKEFKKEQALFAAQHSARGSSGNQLIALILCFFLGALGIHCFYIGKRTKGTIQLIMCVAGVLLGVFGIGFYILYALGVWVLVDFIRLLIGDMGPGW